jgi:hypothetical protein
MTIIKSTDKEAPRQYEFVPQQIISQQLIQLPIDRAAAPAGKCLEGAPHLPVTRELTRRRSRQTLEVFPAPEVSRVFSPTDETPTKPGWRHFAGDADRLPVLLRHLALRQP